MANKLAKLGDAIAISKSEIVTDSLTTHSSLLNITIFREITSSRLAGTTSWARDEQVPATVTRQEPSPGIKQLQSFYYLVENTA